MKPSWLRVLRHAALSIAALAAGVAALASQNATAAPAAPDEIRVDYAYYSPESLVIRHFGWLEDEFKPDHVAIR